LGNCWNYDLRMQKRVLYIVPSWFTLHYSLRGQLSFLKKNGFDVEVLSESDPRAAHAAINEGVCYHSCNIETSVSPLNDLLSFYQIFWVIKRGNYDIIRSSTKKGSFFTGLAGRLAGVPNILYIVQGLSKDRTNKVILKTFPLIERIICAMAHYVVFISKSNMDLFIENRICRRQKALILGEGSFNGIDTTRFQRTEEATIRGYKLRDNLGIPINAFVMGFVGRLVREKGIVELTEAWKILRIKHHNAHLLLCGPPEIDPDLNDCLRILRIDPRVHFAGFVDDPTYVYAAIDSLVLPTYSEGFGNVLLEAGAMELPVIASRVNGCVDAIVHEQTGLLVEPKNPVALAQAMERVLINTEEARQWGRNGRNRCVELFQQEIIWRQIADFYEKLIANETLSKKHTPF
jgi:glycosyltransferase involved in cell wall biosynthesis